MTEKTDEEVFYRHVLEEYPADEFRWPKTRIVTLVQAVFLSYGIEPPNEKRGHFLAMHFDTFLEEVDVYSIYDISQSAVGAGDLLLHDRIHVKSEDFVKWAKDLKIPIMERFFNKATSVQEDKVDKGAARRDRPETNRKEIFRRLACLYWYYEEQQQKDSGNKAVRYTSPTKLAQKPEMKEVVDLVNKIGGLLPIEDDSTRTSGIDPEWFSDLYPGSIKPGPKPKKSK